MKPLTKLVGISKEEFLTHIKDGQISVRKSRLIPFHKPGDEMALTSVFLSGVRLIREFRLAFFSKTKTTQGNEILYFTEPSFKIDTTCRFDGMIVVIKNKKILDVLLLEIKNGNTSLDKEQLEKYSKLCKELGIKKLITISNQFVSDETQCPLGIKSTKSCQRYHFSWTYMLTIAHLLLFKSENIQDADQIEIMKEILAYFEHKKSGVLGFNRMKRGWSSFSDSVVSGATVKASDPDVQEAVESWLQEEKNLSLMMSRKLGVLVETKSKRSKETDKKRTDGLKKELIKTKSLKSSFKIKNTVSWINLTAFFDKRSTEFSASIDASDSNTSRGNISWMKKEIESSSRKSPSFFKSIEKDLFVDIYFKNTPIFDRISWIDFQALTTEYNNKSIREFKITITTDYGKQFSSQTKFIDILENTAVSFYMALIQNLKPMPIKAPKMKKEKEQFLGPKRNTSLAEPIYMEHTSQEIQESTPIPELTETKGD